MATGDVQGGVERLRGELRHIRYPAEVDATGAKLGVPAAFLPVLNYVLLKFSRHVAHQLVSAGYELHGKTDARFVEVAFKVFRDKFGLRPVLTAAQFLEQGFAERKLMLMSDVIAYCKSFHNAAVRRARLAAASAPSKSAKDGGTSTKATLSQLSKGSRKSKTKSGATKAVQPRVQRHSDQPEQADEAVLQARLGPSAAQLATSEQAHSESGNPWGPPAHAVGTRPARSGPLQAVHVDQTHAASGQHTQPDGRLAHTAAFSQERQAAEVLKQPRGSWLHQRGLGHTQQAAQHHAQQHASQFNGELDATQAWIVNPAFGSESLMPSPEKQPRSQPPPLPHPSGYSGPVQSVVQHPTAHSSRAPGLPEASAHAYAHQDSAQHTHGVPRLVPNQQTGHKDQLYSLTHGAKFAQAGHKQPGSLVSEPSSQPGSGLHTQLQANSVAEDAGMSIPWQVQHSQQYPTLPSHYQGASQQPAGHGSPHQMPQHLPQPAQQPSAQSGSHHHLAQLSQMQDALARQQQEEPQHQQAMSPQQDVRGDDSHRLGVPQCLQQLRQQLAAAEERAAEARQESERRAHTLEARITLLEGRVRMVEGELAAERKRNSPAAAAAAKDFAISSGTHCSGDVAACPVPSAAKPRQGGTPAVQEPIPSARQLDDRPLHTCKQDISASPTRSTAATPRFKPSMAARQSSISAMAQQSPVRLMKPAPAPASPASSMHSFKSTSELIESIQNRYLEAQSFLKSYKF